MTTYKTTLWQNYEVDPLDLIGKSARITVVTDEGATSGGRWGNGHYYFGVIETIHEHRGVVYLDKHEPGDNNWASENISVDFTENYPFVDIGLRGGVWIRFNPERDAVSIQWLSGGES